MKKVLIVLCVVSSVMSQTRIALSGNKSGSYPVMAKENVVSVIDTTENMASGVYFDLIEDEVKHLNADTLGYAWLRCSDSAGTDSIGGKLSWFGNPRVDGTGTWDSIGSVTITSGTGTTYLQTGAWVVNTKAYMSFKFKLLNQLVAAAGKKSRCYAVLNRKKRLGGVN